MTAHPNLFGKKLDLDFHRYRDRNSVEQDRSDAAHMQNHFAYRILDAIRMSKYKTIENYAAAAKADPTRVARMLRGAILMRLEDIATAQRVLGLPLLTGRGLPDLPGDEPNFA